MEQDYQPYVPPTPPTPNLLYIDDQNRNFLRQAATWGKFLAIVGFIYCGLIILVAIFMGTLFSSFPGFSDSDMPGFGSMFTGGFFTVLLIAVAVLYFFPCYYLYNFANKMQVALRNNDQSNLTGSFQNLRSNLR